MRRVVKLSTYVPALVLMSGMLFAEQVHSAEEPLDPEVTTGVQTHQVVIGAQSMVVTANPHASNAADAMLKNGGSAMDAAIAAQLVLGLVEPQSSGIGGGAFLLHYSGPQKQLVTYDGREVAPAAAKPDRFLQDNGKPMKWIEALVGGRSVGVPGVVAMLEKAHKRHGKLPWTSLFTPAIELAEQGFEVSPRLAGLLSRRYNPGLTKIEPAASYFYPDGKPLQAGILLKNPEFAKTLRTIAAQGAKGFYQGEVATGIVNTVSNSPANPGDITEADLASYTPVIREPLCGPYRQYKVCGMGPPSSGGFAIIQLLALLQDFDMSGISTSDVQASHLFTQASRLAFADRDFYIADPDFIDVPTAKLLAPEYLKRRAVLIDSDKDIGRQKPGTPIQMNLAAGDTPELPSTSHVSIVDRWGNIVSMTSSIEMAFGSALMTGGFLLNNQLTDFSLAPSQGGSLVANAVAGGKRPRSSMAPMIVFDEKNSPLLIIGSPGGSRIIDYVAQTILSVLDGKVGVQYSINLPKITNRNDYTALEKGRWSEEAVNEFEKRGHVVKQQDLNSGLHGILKVKKGWQGGADLRREGLAIGH
ncbi:gamma-glutamyltransferase [Echinimonas agarilytica]|uniref:Glutathione hydrolase proenzyme n=1 Tax=Echinimonas agarilytica TaxID=1215918 RepID=A0AA41W5H1_9GAMM|nr:gamma-glutamyltransferase [Echinimonas agarilytica]MCM2679332.1 gamma-glutamyltransferase [Echinimonas agarilytica]